jgi:hypothetical protein
MAGFSLAQPVYNLLLQTPVFLVARQNTALDVWVLVFVLSLVIPLLIAIPAWLTYKKMACIFSRMGLACLQPVADTVFCATVSTRPG